MADGMADGTRDGAGDGPAVARGPARGGGKGVHARPRLGDYSADRRVLRLTGMALVTGSLATGAAWLLLRLIALATNLAWFGRLSAAPAAPSGAPTSAWTVLVPVLGAVVIGLMARFGSEKIRGHGIPEAMEAILAGGSRMSPKVALLKPVSAAVSIGTGGPFGAEGPIIVTGGALGSLFAQFFHLSAAERKALLVAGAAAGMTAIFGTPLAAVLLAVEVLLFEWRPRSLIPVVAAVVAAHAWRPLILDPGPLFPLAHPEGLPAWTPLASVGVGLVLGLAAGGLTRALYVLEDGFARLPVHWMWWPALGGLVVGLGGLVEPRALGVGYDVIADLLGGSMLVRAVLLILAVKAAIWLVALASGTSGGVLAPLLIVGGAIGWLIGLGLPGTPGFWALVGMAAMLGGTLPAPLTGALFAAEVSGDFRALVPLLAAAVAAYAVTVLLLKRSILTEKIARRGQHVTREYGIDPYDLARVGAVMTRTVETLPGDLSIPAAVAAVEAGRHHAYPVTDADGRPVGFVTRADALGWGIAGVGGERPAERPAECLAERVSDAALPVVHPDDVVSAALDLMLATGAGRLPVTDPASGALVGLLTRRDLLQVRAGVVRAEAERRAYFARRQPGAPGDGPGAATSRPG